jgi:CRP-like cAMP-binding protein
MAAGGKHDMIAKPEMVEEFRRRFPGLAGDLGPRNLEVLVGATTVLELPEGRKVIRDRMPVDSLYMVLDGELTISVEENKKAIRLGHVGPGQLLGEVSVLSGELLASSTVESRTPVKLLRLRHEKFGELIATNYEVANALLKQLVGMLADRLRISAKSFSEHAASDAAHHIDAPGEAPEKPGQNWLKSFFDRVPGT